MAEKNVKGAYIYGSWYDSIEQMPDKAKAYDYLKAIMDYQFFGDYDRSDSAINVFMEQVKFNLSDRDRRFEACKENGAKGGRPLKYDYIAIAEAYLYPPDGKKITQKKVADMFGCPDAKQVSRAVKRYKEEGRDKTGFVPQEEEDRTKDKTGQNWFCPLEEDEGTKLDKTGQKGVLSCEEEEDQHRRSDGSWDF